ncbi:PAO, partial [Symbiodinium sp. CCMP2456]
LRATATKTKTKTKIRPTPQAVPAQSAPEWRERHWFPVASTLELDPKRPTPVRIDGLDLVVWQVPGEEGHENGGWKVMLDACAHRLAPLSEGRIEPKTGCLQCAYHGWEFNAEGSCTKIPQVEETEAVKMCANPRSRVRSFPTTVALKLVWVWLGESEAKGSPAELVTGTHLDEMEILGSYTRDLPY